MNHALDQRIADAQEPAVQEAIRAVQASLINHVSRCETMMGRLGLTIIRPEAGEICDDVYHSGTNGEIMPGMVIVRCVCPGVAMCGDYAPVLIPAQVVAGVPEEEVE